MNVSQQQEKKELIEQQEQIEDITTLEIPNAPEGESLTAEARVKRQQTIRRRWYGIATVVCVVVLGGTLWLSQREGIRLSSQESMTVQTPTVQTHTPGESSPTPNQDPQERGSITVTQQIPEGAIVGKGSKTLYRFRLQSLSETGQVLETQYQQMSFGYGLYTVDGEGYTTGKIKFDNLPPGRYRVSQMSLSEEERRGLQSSTTTGVMEEHIATFWIGILPTEEELAGQPGDELRPEFPLYDAGVTFLLQNRTTPQEPGDPLPWRVNC